MLLLSLLCFDLSNIAFGVWTSDGWAVEKLVPALRTWMTLVPEIHIFARELKNKTIEKLKQGTASNTFIHILPITEKTVFENSTSNFGILE